MLHVYSPAGSRPGGIKREERLILYTPRPPRPGLARRNSLELRRPAATEPARLNRSELRHDELSFLKEELRRAKEDAEKYRTQNLSLENKFQIGRDYKESNNKRLAELSEENKSLESEIQRSERQRDELMQQLRLSKQESEKIRLNFDALGRERDSLFQENVSIREDRERIRKRSVTVSTRLAILQAEANTLRKENEHRVQENEHLVRENAGVKDEFKKKLDSLTTERVSLQKQVDGLVQEKEQRDLTIQQERDLEERRQEFEEFKRVNEKLLQESEQREKCLQNELQKLKSPTQPCPRPDCMQLKADKAKLTKKLEKKCERSDCVKAKADLDKAEKRIKQMEKKTCSSLQCKNQELKSMNDAIGSKVRIGDQEYSHSEALGFLFQILETQHNGGDMNSQHSRLQRLQLQNQQLQQQLTEALGSSGRAVEGECRNETCRAVKVTLQRRAEEIQQKFYAEKCPRPDCQKFHDRLKSIEFEAQRKGRSPAKDVSIMCGGDHDIVLQDFDELFSDINPDGILGVLEGCLESFEARRLLCEIFQHAYEACKEASLERISHTLEALFVVHDKKGRKSDLGDASRAYGLLLHMTGLKEDESVCRDICLQIPTVFSKSESYQKASKELSVNQECLMKVLKVAWKFVILPNPIIACQPSQYVPQNVDREYGYWDDSTPDAQLIYTRPVVYRCYDGKRAIKGMVANTEKTLEEPSKGIFKRATDFVKEFAGGVVNAMGGHGEVESVSGIV